MCRSEPYRRGAFLLDMGGHYMPEKLQALDSARALFVRLGQPLRETDAALEVAKAHLELIHYYEVVGSST
jgi:hypothetical protein